MSIEALAWALQQQPDDPLQKLVLILLAEAEPREYYATFEGDELAEAACSSYDAVIDALDRLEGLDLISWQWDGDAESNYVRATFHSAPPEQRRAGLVQGFLYVLDGRDPDGGHVWSKVGITRDLDRRLRALRRDSAPHWHVHSAWRLPMADGRRVEERLGEASMRRHHWRDRWYAMPAEEAAAGVAEVLRLLKLSVEVEEPTGSAH